MTGIPRDSEFADAIRAVLSTERPRRILETGTYDGLGSTAVLLDAIHGYGLQSTFCTIEADPACCRKARLVAGDRLMEGLSIPADILPTLPEIQERLKNLPAGIAVDYDEDGRDLSYFHETEKNVDDDMIGVFCRKHGQPDFAILDSAGHIGTIEAIYLLGYCREPMVLALDDTEHFKHYETVQRIKGNRESFDVLLSGYERNGWMLVRYRP